MASKQRKSESDFLSSAGDESTRRNSTESHQSVPEGPFNKADITLADLKLLKQVFDDAAADCGGQLSEERFLAAFGPILGTTMTEEHMRLWFMRIDASANGEVDWDEFSSFLLYSAEKDSVTTVTSSGVAMDEVCFVKDARATNATQACATRSSGYNHSEQITRILVHPRSGKYYTSSQDGTVRVWDGSSNLAPFESILYHGKGWVTDMCFARDATKLVIATVDRQIIIYDVHTEKLFRAFVGNTQQSTKEVMLPWLRSLTRADIDLRHVSANKKPQESIEEYRLRQERVRQSRDAAPTMKFHALNALDVPALCLAVIPSSEGDQIYLGLANGSVQSYGFLSGGVVITDALSPTFNMMVHTSRPIKTGMDESGKDAPKQTHHHLSETAFITSLIYIPSLGSLVSTGSDGRIYIINTVKKMVARVCEKHAANHPIHGCAWITSERLLATCGNERHVSLWSLNSRGQAIPLKGHLAAVTHMKFREEDNLLFTLDADKCIKVWNMRTLRVIQSMIDYDVYMPLNRMSALTYDERRHCLVTGVYAPVVWAMGRLLVPYPDPSYRGHQKPIHSALYNEELQQIVTADSDQIRFWNLEDGSVVSTLTIDSLRSTAVKTSVSSDSYGAIYCVCFDFSKRRLLVAVTCGVVFVANFANGQLLQELVPQLPDRDRREYAPAESSAMTYNISGSKRFIIVLRGNELLIWEDVAEGTLEKRLDRIVIVDLPKPTYLFFAVTPPPADVVSGATRWRAPAPLTVCGMPPAHFAVGTDCGLTIVYSSISFDVHSVFGSFDTNINVAALYFDDRRELLFVGKNDATIDVLSQTSRDWHFCLSLRDPFNARHPNATSMFVVGATLAVTLEDGYVMLFDIHNFSLLDLPPMVPNKASILSPLPNFTMIGGFQAHHDDAWRVTLICNPVRPGTGSRSPRDDHSGRTSPIKVPESVPAFIFTTGVDCQGRLWKLDDSMQRVDLVGYCGAPAGWLSSQWQDPATAVATIPGPVVQWSRSVNYFQVAEEVRIAMRSGKPLVDANDLNAGVSDRAIFEIAASEPSSPSLARKRFEEAEQRKKVDRLIAEPTLRQQTKKEKDGRLLADHFVPSSSALLERADTRASGAGSPPSTSRSVTSLRATPRVPTVNARVGITKQTTIQRRRSSVMRRVAASSSMLLEASLEDDEDQLDLSPRAQDVQSEAGDDDGDVVIQMSVPQPVSSGNQTPRLPPIVVVATPARQPAAATARTTREKLTFLPQLDLTGAAREQHRQAEIAAAQIFSQGAKKSSTNHIAGRRGSGTPRVPALSASTLSNLDMPRISNPHSRSPSRQEMLEAARVAAQYVESANLLAEEREQEPSVVTLDEDARLRERIERERALPISVRLDAWRRATHEKPQDGTGGDGKAWSARPHEKLRIQAVGEEFMTVASGAKKKHQWLAEIDNRTGVGKKAQSV